MSSHCQASKASVFNRDIPTSRHLNVGRFTWTQEMTLLSLPLLQTNHRLPYRLAVLAVILMVRQVCVKGEEIDAVAFQLLTPPLLRGNLSSNNILSNAERLHTRQIGIPHSYVTFGDDVYTVTASGLVVNVASCRPTIIANLKPRGCRSLQECGHLISIRLSKDYLLIVLDAYRGIFEVHPVTGVIRHIYDSRTTVNGRPSIYLNDFVILEDGTIIMSDSSPRFDYDHEFWIRFEGRSDGRLIGFSPINGQSKEILSGLAYPTGLEITYNGQGLLVSEASRARILRLELNKSKFFQRSYVNINLAGMPGHIRKSGHGGTYWVGLSYPRHRGETSMLDQYSNKPAARNFMALRRTAHELQLMYKNKGLAVELDEVGKIHRSIHDPSGQKVGEVLEVTEYIGVLYVGTRAQQSTVRVVGSPKELTVDSLVQVLRGRCKVTEDKVLETKESIEQQLKGNNTKEPKKSTETIKQYTPSPNKTLGGEAESLKAVKPKLTLNLQSLSQSLSKLHKSLFNAAVSKKSSSTVYPSTQAVNQLGVTTSPSKEIIETHQATEAYNNTQINFQYNLSTKVPFENPSPASQSHTPQDKTAETSTLQFTQQNVSSPSQSHIRHRFQGGLLISHVVANNNDQESLKGYQSGSKQHETSYSELPSDPSNLPIRQQTQVNISYTSSINKPTIQYASEVQHQTGTPQPTVDLVSQQNPPADTNDIGGFMGFLGNSDIQSGTTKSPTSHQDPYSFSVPDPGLYGQIEPVLGENPGSSQQGHQFLPGMESVTNFEQRILTNNQTSSKVEQVLVNQTQTSPPQSSSLEPINSFKPAEKRLDMSVQDISIKDATAIQNMQMFHPTDRPEQVSQLQSQAGAQEAAAFHEKTSLLNHEIQQLINQEQTHRIPLDHNPNEVYANAQSGSFSIQVPQGQNKGQQNAQSMTANAHVGSFTAGSAMSQQLRTSHFSSNTQVENFDPGAPLNQGFSVGNIYDPSINHDLSTAGNNTNNINQFMISGAARVHHLQPLNDDYKDITWVRNGQQQVNIQSSRDAGSLTSHTEKTAVSRQQSTSKTLGYTRESSRPTVESQWGNESAPTVLPSRRTSQSSPNNYHANA